MERGKPGEADGGIALSSRRRWSVQACRQPGVSIASVAMSHGLNAKLLRRWLVLRSPAQAALAPKPRAGRLPSGARCAPQDSDRIP